MTFSNLNLLNDFLNLKLLVEILLQTVVGFLKSSSPLAEPLIKWNPNMSTFKRVLD